MIVKKLPTFIFFISSLLFLIYLSFPEPDFPTPLWDFKVSNQPADQESPQRRGYYTNLTREQLMSHYSKEFDWGIRLNYPPEMAQILIRDQTKSSYLEEIVHPFRESLYVNGFRPASDEEILEVEGVRYQGKTIIKYVGSNLILRLVFGAFSIAAGWVLLNEWIQAVKQIKWTYQ